MADLLNATPCLGKFLSASIWGEPNGTWTLYEKYLWFMIFHHLKSAWFTIETRKYLKIFSHAKQEIRQTHSHRDFGSSKSAHEHYMKRKIRIRLKFHAPAIWDHPWAGNQARKSKLRVRPPRTIQNSENKKIEKNSAKLQENSIFRCLKYIVALLTQQIIWMRDGRHTIEWLVEHISLRYISKRVIRERWAASWPVSKKMTFWEGGHTK